ncbi:MAG: ATP-binding protein [Desulfobacterales bacterium]|jgi:serine/threonine-protein kinase RsbW
MNAKEPMVKKLNNHAVEVSLPSKLGYERIAMDCSASFAKMAGFAPDRIEDLKTAVAEACLNAIEHGNKGHPDTRVLVTMDFKDNRFSVLVKDNGKGMSRIPRDKTVMRRIENLEPPKGLGTFLIKQLMDEVEFNNLTADGHSVRMVIKLTDRPLSLGKRQTTGGTTN